MLKRILIVLLLFFIYYSSSTSGILVSEPTTWNNGQQKDPNSEIKHIFDAKSVFFDTYFEDDHTIEDLSFEFYIRKLVHILTYSFLSFLIFLNLPRIKFRFIVSFLLTVSISLLDEANQFITYGRSGRLWDVYLDSAASFITLFFLFIAYLIYKKNKLKKR
jgi:hypothetical protein